MPFSLTTPATLTGSTDTDAAPAVSRRGALLTAAGGLGLASVASSATAAGTTHVTARLERARPRRARAPRTPRAVVNPAADLVAVRVFPSYRTAVYGNHDAVLARLADLGVKRMSHNCARRSPPPPR